MDTKALDKAKREVAKLQKKIDEAENLLGQKTKKRTGKGSDAYRQAKYAKKQQQAHTNIAPLPPPPPEYDAARRQRCIDSLLEFLSTYFPGTMSLAWSEDHLKLIDKIQHAIVHGGLSALALPRGSGKTSILLRAALWAILTGHRKYVCIVGATEDAATENLRDIKTEILYNEELGQDFYEELHCLREVNNEPRKCGGQHFDGKLTAPEWTASRIDFGTIAGVPSSGALISVCGLLGQIRGQKKTKVDGETVRPDLALIDDPQTKESAGSESQCRKRHETMMGDVLGMAGPGKKIAGFCACTVIYANDLAARILDRTLSPDWQGQTVRMVYQWPEWREGWDKYADIRERELREDGDGSEAREFVQENFERLHKGHKVYWEERYNHDEESALHHAYNLFFRDQGAFYAEYQNDPLTGGDDIPFELIAEQISRRTTDYGRGTAPLGTDKITAFIDVQKKVLMYTVVAWTKKGRGYVIDYGSCPDQRTHHFTKNNIRFTMEEAAGTHDMEEYLRFNLDVLADLILDNDVMCEDGSLMSVDKLAIDARWGEITEVVRRFVNESTYRHRVHAAFGQYIGANSRSWQKIKAERYEKGVHCKMELPKDQKRGRKQFIVDVNFWKSYIAEKLCCNQTSNRAITLFYDEAYVHRMFAEHMCQEVPSWEHGKDGRQVIEWRPRQKGTIENDYWDCLVGCAALASHLGIETHDKKTKTTTGARPRFTNKLVKKDDPDSPVEKKPPTTAGGLSFRERMQRRKRT